MNKKWLVILQVIPNDIIYVVKHKVCSYIQASKNYSYLSLPGSFLDDKILSSPLIRYETAKTVEESI